MGRKLTDWAQAAMKRLSPAALATLAACASSHVEQEKTMLHMRLEPVQLALAPQGELQESERKRIAAFVHGYQENRAGNHLIVALPKSGADAKKLKAITAAILKGGVPKAHLTGRSYDPGKTKESVGAERGTPSAEKAPGIRLVYYRRTASVPDCAGRWERDAFSTNGPQAGFGCANHNNMAVMLADPDDLARPRPVSRRVDTRLDPIFSQYRKNELEPLDSLDIDTRQ